MTFVDSMKSKAFTWLFFLHVAALADLTILLWMLLTRQDLLALALAGVILLGLGLLRLGSGWLGLLVLGLVFADISVWTISGGVSNFINREPLSRLLIPSFLGIISLSGVIAAIAAWLTRRNPEQSRLAARIFSQVVLSLLFLVLLAGLVFSSRPVQASTSIDIDLTTEQMKYSHGELAVDGDQITVHLVNNDLWWHTFTIDELGVDLKVPMDADRQLTFSAPPGTYRFYCSIPGHEAIGMVGTLTVTD